MATQLLPANWDSARRRPPSAVNGRSDAPRCLAVAGAASLVLFAAGRQFVRSARPTAVGTTLPTRRPPLPHRTIDDYPELRITAGRPERNSRKRRPHCREQVEALDGIRPHGPGCRCRRKWLSPWRASTRVLQMPLSECLVAAPVTVGLRSLRACRAMGRRNTALL